MRIKTLLPLLLAGASLSACAVGPDYQRPVTALPAQFAGQAAVDARAAPAASADLVSWWKSFDDPLLAAFVERALARNLDLEQALARVSQSRAALHSATAALLPSGQVSGQAAASRQSLETPSGRIGNALGADRDGELYELDLGASWEVDVFGGLRRSQEAAQAQWQASGAAAMGTRLAIAAQTADTYVTIRGLQARLAIAQHQVETQQKLVDTVTLQYRKGIAAELQLRQAEGALAQVQSTVPVLENALDVAENALDVLMGDQTGTSRAQLAADMPIPAAPAIATADGPAALLRRRPDIIAAERTLVATNAGIGQAMAEYFPKFSLSGLLGTATTGPAGLFTGAATQGTAAIGLRWRLFDFGRIDAEIKAARGRDAEALAAYRLTVLHASEDVENAFSALVKREAQEQTLATGEASLTRARDASLAAYKGGVVSLIEVLDADSRLLATRDARAQAQTEATRAAIASFRALGGGWDGQVTKRS